MPERTRSCAARVRRVRAQVLHRCVLCAPVLHRWWIGREDYQLGCVYERRLRLDPADKAVTHVPTGQNASSVASGRVCIAVVLVCGRLGSLQNLQSPVDSLHHKHPKEILLPH